MRIINEYQEKCRDEYININRLTYDSDNKYRIGKNLIENAKDVEFTNYAENQLLQRLHIPIKYYRSCPFWLRELNFNHWSSKADKEYLLRYYSDKVRGFMSRRFSINKDDKDVFPIILDTLPNTVIINYFQKGTELSILSTVLEESRAHTLDEVEMQVGISIINSEVGHSALTITPTVKISDNEYTFLNLQGEGTTRIIHVGDINRDKVVEALIKAENVGEAAAAQAVLIGKQIVNKPIEKTKHVLNSYQELPEELMKMVEEELTRKEEQTTRMELAVLIMKCVENLPKINNDLKKRLSAQSAAGQIFGIFTNTDNVIEQLVQIIE